MFSGLVESKTQLIDTFPEEGGVKLLLRRPPRSDGVRIGDSICIQGCCLTVVELTPEAFSFQAGEETLSKTSLGSLPSGASVNFERSLKLGDRIGGHLVTGHVDGLGQVKLREDNAEWSNLTITAASELLRQMAPKASITIDGVSLTLVEVREDCFTVALIPHTLANTTLGDLKVGDNVNLETDLLAKYVQRQIMPILTSNSPN